MHPLNAVSHTNRYVLVLLPSCCRLTCRARCHSLFHDVHAGNLSLQQRPKMSTPAQRAASAAAPQRPLATENRTVSDEDAPGERGELDAAPRAVGAIRVIHVYGQRLGLCRSPGPIETVGLLLLIASERVTRVRQVTASFSSLCHSVS